MHLIIVEDLEIDREVLANLILDDCSRQEERADLSFYSSGEDFLARYRPKCCDGLFLDVLLDGVNGIDIAGRVREAEPDLPIIITTRERDFAVDGFAVKATDYLVKPLEQDRFLRTMNRAMQVLAQRSHQHLTIQKGHTLQLIPLSQILYCEVLGRKVHIHQEDGQVFHYYEKLEALQQQLAGHFFRCHRSYLVNLDHVRGCSGGQVRLSDGSAIPVSRLREQELIQALLHHIKERAF